MRTQALLQLVLLAMLGTVGSAQRIAISNDDGWATAQVRAEFNALNAAGYDVHPSHVVLCYALLTRGI